MAIILGLFFLTSCDVDQNIELEEAMSVSQEMVSTQVSFANLYQEVLQSAQSIPELNSSGQSFFVLADCVKLRTVSNGAVFFPVIYELDFGADCLSGDHRFSGKLTAEFSGYLDQDGCNVIVNLKDFVVDGKQIQGTYSFVNKGKDDLDRLVVEHQIINGKTIEDQQELNFGASILSTLIAENLLSDSNALTPVLETTWEESVNATFVSEENIVYSVTSETPIVNISSLPIPVAGMLKLENLTTQQSFFIDFGDFQRDNAVFINIGESTKEVIL